MANLHYPLTPRLEHNYRYLTNRLSANWPIIQLAQGNDCHHLDFIDISLLDATAMVVEAAAPRVIHNTVVNNTFNGPAGAGAGCVGSPTIIDNSSTTNNSSTSIGENGSITGLDFSI